MFVKRITIKRHQATFALAVSVFMALQMFCSCSSGTPTSTKDETDSMALSTGVSEQAESSGSMPVLCFECTYPGGGKRIVFREYIQLSNDHGRVSGMGAGYSEGDPEWVFDFKGMLKDTLLELTANYRQEGVEPFSTTETWFVNLEKGSIRLKEPLPESLRSVSNGEYHKVECDYIPENLRKLMDKNKN